MRMKGSLEHGDSPLAMALDFLEREIRSGLGHGFFELKLTSEVIKNRKRRLVLNAGKTYIFVITEEDLKH